MGAQTLLLAALAALLLLQPLQKVDASSEDAELLLSFRDGLENYTEPRLSQWTLTSPLCSWYGVECAAPGADQVSALHLSGAGLKGTLPSLWGAEEAFQQLLLLDLPLNSLSGTLPESWATSGAFPRLQKLYLFNNSLTGPLPAAWGRLGAFPELLEIEAESNNFSGSLPPEWGSVGAFPKLEDVTLQHNRFSGAVPPEWGGPAVFQTLEYLDLHNNTFNGSLPVSWGIDGAFPRLTFINFDDNFLSGSLPREWGSGGGLASLRVLELDSNLLTGELPSEWGSRDRFPALSLAYLYLNGFNGTLPASWGSAGAFPQLTVLDVHSNFLPGGLPKEWAGNASFPRLETLALHDNRLQGTLPPEWGSNSSFVRLSVLDLHNNTLTGPMPSQWGRNGSFQNLDYFDVSDNRLGERDGDEEWPAELPAANIIQVFVARNNYYSRLPSAWTSNSLKVLSVSGSTAASTIIPTRWLRKEAFPNLVWMDVDNKTWDVSVKSDNWKKTVCIDKDLFTTDKFEEMADLLSGLIQESKTNATTSKGTSIAERTKEELLLSLLDTFQIRNVSYHTICANPKAPLVVGIYWGVVAALVLAIGLTYYCWVRAMMQGETKEGSFTTHLTAFYNKYAIKLVGMISLLVYWVDIASDLVVIISVWGRWPGYALLVSFLAQFVISGTIVTAYVAPRDPNPSQYWHSRLVQLGWFCAVEIAGLPALDTLVLLCLAGCGPAVIYNNLDLDHYQLMRDVNRGFFAALPTAILLSIVYIQGNNPTSGWYLSENIFIFSFTSSALELLKVFSLLLFYSDGRVFKYLGSVFTGRSLASDEQKPAPPQIVYDSTGARKLSTFATTGTKI